MSKRKFYKTTYTITVLSEEPLNGYEHIDQIIEGMDEGDLVGVVDGNESDVLDGQQVVDELYALGSEPSFFQLNEFGEDIED